MSRDRIFMWVPHHLAHDYILMGWVMRDTLMNTHHSYYAILFEWLCECPPPIIPRKELS